MHATARVVVRISSPIVNIGEIGFCRYLGVWSAMIVPLGTPQKTVGNGRRASWLEAAACAAEEHRLLVVLDTLSRSPKFSHSNRHHPHIAFVGRWVEVAPHEAL